MQEITKEGDCVGDNFIVSDSGYCYFHNMCLKI